MTPLISLNLKKRWPWAVLAAVLIVAAALLILWPPAAVSAIGSQPGETSSTSSYEVSRVTRGDLAIEAVGSGALVAGQTADLAFLSSGTVTGLTVQAGDEVTTGQVLASLVEIDELELNLETRQLELKKAQETLANLQSGGDQALADALAGVVEARQTYAEAQQNLRLPGVGSCEKSVTESYWRAYFYAVLDARPWEHYLESDDDGYGDMYLQDKLKPIYEARDKAYANWKYCEGYTAEEIETSSAALQLAEARLLQAERLYEKLLANQGVDPVSVELAEASVRSAELNLADAQTQLEAARLVAPFDGTVIAVNVQDGDEVVASNTVEETSSSSSGDSLEAMLQGMFGGESGASTTADQDVMATDTILTIANLSKSYVEASFDETDLGSIAEGCAASVNFTSFTTRVFKGQVTAIAPSLATANQVSSVEAAIQLEDVRLNPQRYLPLNVAGTVEVTCSTTQDALLAPLSGLYQAADGSRYVYVLNNAGVPEKRSVGVGLITTEMVEITTGLQEGEQVIVSQVSLEPGQ